MATDRLWVTVIKYTKNECEEQGVFISETKPDKNYFNALMTEYSYWGINVYIHPSEQPAKLYEWDLSKYPINQ